jgi:hypothetical protein
LPERDPVELAARLERKAQADATATRKFAADPEIADDIIGFHAQQAVGEVAQGCEGCARRESMTSIGWANCCRKMASYCPYIAAGSTS